ncbi:MAG: hypothetical protein PHV23_02110 [Candidatus Gracilibacteria bacterium]|nr:hypothetical protein [Candidatus Gracilibacteria bacterium]
MTRRRGSNSALQKNIKDYIVPIIGGILVLFLIFSLFSGNSGSETKTNVENQSGISVKLDSDSSSATLIYPGDYKKELEGDQTLYKGEKVLVKQGTVSLSLDNLVNFKVNRLGELTYLENGDFSITSGEAWLDTSKSINLNMNFASLKIDENSHLSFSQNEVESTIYLISGFVEVSNLVGKNTVLAPGEKITISRADASKKDLDLTLIKENTDQFFLKSDWFILNKGLTYIPVDDTNTDDTGSGTTLTGSIQVGSSSDLLTFNNLVDESNVSSPLIKISGVYNNSDISSITVNGKSAVLDKTTNTFKFENIDVSNKENDLVFKVYDDSNDIISRFVYTVYYSLGSSGNTTSTSGSTTNGFKVQTFSADGSDFTFTAPTTTNTYTSNENFITIKGKVNAEGIDKVTVNDFELGSFNGSTWRYHADVEYNNLADGTNVYEVKYFSAGKLVFTNYFTIIRKGNVTTEEPVIDSSTENTQ